MVSICRDNDKLQEAATSLFSLDCPVNSLLSDARMEHGEAHALIVLLKPSGKTGEGAFWPCCVADPVPFKPRGSCQCGAQCTSLGAFIS